MKPGDTNLVAKLILFRDKSPLREDEASLREVLVLKRADKFITEKSPWVWDLPGGHLELGESPLEAAYRETQEETSLVVEEARFLGYHFTGGKLTYFYDSPKWQGTISLSHEHQNSLWINAFELHLIKDGIGETYYNVIMKVLS